MEVSKINGYDIKDKKSVRTYDTVHDMKIDGNLKEGQHIKTRGYYAVNDGGSAEYYITSTESLNDYQENLNSGLYANLVNKENISVKQFGAKGDGTTDDTTSIQNAINFAISNKSDLIVNATSEYYKITKPLKIICEVSSLGFWGGTGLSFIGENKGNCRIVKIGNYVYTEESITELNNINATVVSLCELYPSLEVTGLDNVTVDNLAILSDSVVCVNVDLVSSGDEGESLVKVCEKLIGVSCVAGIVTGSLNTAGESTCTLETSYVVCLPAVHTNANIGKFCDSRFGVNTILCVDFLSGLVSCVCHNDLLCIMYFLFLTF